MKSFTKRIIFLVILIFNVSYSFSMGKQSSQLIKSGHWLYDDLTLLTTEAKTSMIMETQPMSVGEIEFFLKEIDYNELSDSGKVVYKRVQDFLSKDDDLVDAEEFRFFINLKLTPEFYFKSNKNIDWSFDPYYIKDNPFTVPVIIGYGDLFTIQSDFFYGKQPSVVKNHDNFTNMPILPKHSNFYYPEFSYFAFNKSFNKWGFSGHMGKKGLQVGNPEMESIIYSKLFDTDFYVQLNLYSKYLKYSMDVSQINNETYFYLHQLTFRPWKNVNLGLMEGSLINAPFELRFLNPFNIMHEYAGWHDYTKTERDKYGESNFCAYLALTFEYLPIKNLRIYGMYAQNEMVDPGSCVDKESLSVPSSIGGQLGVEYVFPMKNKAHLKTGLEVVYTSPFLYLKASPKWSLYSSRGDEYGNGPFSSWMGSPAGPDSFIVQAKAEYDSNEKWNVSAGYKFMIHGDNTSESLFNEDNYVPYLVKDENGKTVEKYKYWNYYPYIRYRHGNQDVKNGAIDEAQYMWMSGTPEYLNQFTLNSNYKLLDNLELTGQIVYSFVFNNNNLYDNFQQGIELAFAVTYELF